MIIPPDPEKDPNIFDPSASTPSLVPPPSEPTDSTDSASISSASRVRRPARAHTNHAFGYPFGDDLGVGYSGEALPPYERERQRIESIRNASPTEDIFADPPSSSQPMRERNPVRPSLIIPPLTGGLSPLTPPDDGLVTASSSTAHLPLTAPSASSISTTRKLWEGSSVVDRHQAKQWRRWWKKWKKVVYLAAAILIAGIGVLVGVLVGLKAGKTTAPASNGSPWADNDGRSAWVTSGESLNITFVPDRDGPGPEDGTPLSCPTFTPFNISSPLNLLSHPYPAQIQQNVSFAFPLSSANDSDIHSVPNFTLIARGLGSSGTVEVVGTDAPASVIQGGQEGNVTVDVVVSYSGYQNLDQIIKICTLQRDNGIGLGIFTPIQTDGKVSNAYMLNPMLLPSFHVVIRLPPSAYANVTGYPTVHAPSMSFLLDRMAVHFGNLQNVAHFGDITVNSGRGGVTATYAEAETVSIWTGANRVQGTWNISEAISVNSTGGSIESDLILHDPSESGAQAQPEYFEYQSRRRDVYQGDYDPNDPSDDPNGSGSDIDVSDRWSPSSTSSSAYPNATHAPSNNSSNSTKDSPPPKPHSISTTFVTSQGYIHTAYLAHPPKVALSSLVWTQKGDIRVGLHPNYVGPFVVNNVWGQVRLLHPAPVSQLDPMQQERTRSYLLGPVDATPGDMYDQRGFNASCLATSADSVSGVATWLNTTESVLPTPQTVQHGAQSRGEVLVMGAWGDITVGFDGQSP